MAHLKFSKVTIEYPIYNARAMSLRNHLVRIGTGGIIDRETSGVQFVKALDAVSFVLRDGDAVGLVGHNGAGKSTLLRTMAGVYAPASGLVDRQGSVATMLELGAGMDIELSGYENIKRMALLRGLTLKQIHAVLPDIEAFTDLGDFLNLPVRTYSSGMSARLMFAVATAIAPEILLIDEVFNTGDTSFQDKANARMQKMLQSVSIMVLASHDMRLIEQNCNRFFRLEHGSITEIDKADLPKY